MPFRAKNEGNTPIRRRTVTSSSNEIPRGSTEKGAVVRGWGEALLRPLPQLLDGYLRTK